MMRSRSAVLLLLLAAGLVPACAAGELRVGVVEVQGDAGRIHRLQREPLVAGTFLEEKDYVTTAGNALAILDIPGRGRVTVPEHSRLALHRLLPRSTDAGEEIILGVLDGGVRARLAPLGKEDVFTVKTPVAVVGVRGTDFVVTTVRGRGNAVSTRVTTISGAVSVQPRKDGGRPPPPVVVARNQRLEVQEGAPPGPPVAVPAAEMREIAQAMPVESSAERAQEPAAKPEESRKSGGPAAPPAGPEAPPAKDGAKAAEEAKPGETGAAPQEPAGQPAAAPAVQPAFPVLPGATPFGPAGGPAVDPAARIRETVLQNIVEERKEEVRQKLPRIVPGGQPPDRQ